MAQNSKNMSFVYKAGRQRCSLDNCRNSFLIGCCADEVSSFLISLFFFLTGGGPWRKWERCRGLHDHSLNASYLVIKPILSNQHFLAFIVRQLIRGVIYIYTFRDAHKPLMGELRYNSFDTSGLKRLFFLDDLIEIGETRKGLRSEYSVSQAPYIYTYDICYSVCIRPVCLLPSID